ncbi:hypothetical protein SUGI_0930850 [Cryptomeria japonica]|nr:hypothetical protein SUGI_0930850 [Cryptomeria japonica]
MGSSDCSTNSEKSAENENRFHCRRSLFITSSHSSCSASSESSEKQRRNIPAMENNDYAWSPLKPCSIKRQREVGGGKGKEKAKENKNEKKTKENATVVKLDKSGKGKRAAWNAKDEVALSRGIRGCSEKGKPLPRNSVIFNNVKSKLDDEYSDTQMSNKLKLFRSATEKTKNPDFGFKNAHEETAHNLSKEIWGKKEEEETAPGNKRVADMWCDDEEEKKKNKEAEEDLNIGSVKVSVSSLVEVIIEVVKESMDAQKEFFKEMLNENRNTMTIDNVGTSSRKANIFNYNAM